MARSAFLLLCISGGRGLEEELCSKDWHCEDDCSGERSLTLCYRASRLAQRLHQLDTYPNGSPDLIRLERSLRFAEPDDVRQLCLEFARFPKSPDVVEKRLAKCSRAMLQMALVSNVALHPSSFTDDYTCSRGSLMARYPTSLVDDELRYSRLAKERWFFPHYIRYISMVSKWKLFAMLRNHTAKCGRLGYRCAVFNPWEPNRCFSHHPLIEPVAPSCDKKPTIPRRHSKPDQVTDWLGVRWDTDSDLGTGPWGQPELTRRLERWGLAWGPFPGEDYFETISMLRGISTTQDHFVLVEVGSSIGYWSLKAAVAFRSQFGEDGSCDLILIDANYSMGSTAKHLLQNGIYDLCNVSLQKAYASASFLDRLVLAHGHINMLHIDIQGAELDLIKGSDHLSKVQVVHVGTHTRSVHRNLGEELLKKGFVIDYDYPPTSFVRTAFGPVAFDDGILAASHVSNVQRLHDKEERSLCWDSVGLPHGKL